MSVLHLVTLFFTSQIIFRFSYAMPARLVASFWAGIKIEIGMTAQLQPCGRLLLKLYAEGLGLLL